MVRTFVTKTLSLALLFAAVSAANAQERLAPGSLNLTFAVGTAEISEADVQFGARMEKVLKPMNLLGGGILGVQLEVNGHSYPFGAGHRWVLWPVGLSAVYHLGDGTKKLEPTIALGAGYKFINCDTYFGTFADCTTEEEEPFGIARAGLRYFVSDRVALSVDAGLGSALVTGGLVVKIK